MESRVKRTPNLRYKLIRKVMEKYQLQRMVSVLCEASGVSQSGYDRYWSHSAIQRRMQKEQRDEEISLHVRRAFQFKKRNKGARSLKMTLERQYQIIWNLKRIRRIMKKYAMIRPHRKANPYRQMMKPTQEH